MFVCYLIKSVPYKELARDAPCQLRDSGARFLEGCRSPSFLAAEERDVLRQFFAGGFAIFNIIDMPFHYRSLAYLIRAMPVKGVGGCELRGGAVHLAALQRKSALPFFWQAQTPFLTTLAALITFGILFRHKNVTSLPVGVGACQCD